MSAKQEKSLARRFMNWVFGGASTNDFSGIIKAIKDENLIDSGTYGMVYGPYDWGDKRCAVKRIHAKTGSADVIEKKEMWTGLKHENLLEIIDVFQNLQMIYVVMEYAGGGSLRKTLDTLCKSSFKLPINVLWDWSKQIADGMAYLHEKKIVHRDLKSSNVLQTKAFNSAIADLKLTLKIADFDAMREHDGTRTMTVAGTYGWMAPEVLVEERFSKKSDVWSYGVVVWEMITEEVPHKGATQMQLTDLAKSEKLALPIPESIPTNFRQLLNYCFRLSSSGASFRFISDFFKFDIEDTENVENLVKTHKATEDEETTNMLTDEIEDYAMIIGIDNGLKITNEVLKINLYRPSKRQYVENVPSSMMVREADARVYRDTIYIVGLGVNMNEIWKYESKSGWHMCACMMQPRIRHSIAFVGDMLYICGGFVISGEKVLDSVEMYNIVTNTCTSVGNLVHPIESAGNCVPYKKSLFIFGGSNVENNVSSQVQVYDTLQNTCHLLSNPMPRASYLMRAAVLQGKVILFGLHRCMIYDFKTEMWQVREQFKTDVVHFGMVLSNNRIFVIGGGNTNNDTESGVPWKCSDDVRSVAVEEFIENKQVDWKCHGKLPNPCLVYTLAYKPEVEVLDNGDQVMDGGDNLARNVQKQEPHNLAS